MNSKIQETLFASARASAHFALACLEPAGKHLRVQGGFVTPNGSVMHWHEFGDLEGPGWAANLVGGAHLLYRWGRFLEDKSIQNKSLQLLDHFLEAGFVDWQSGMIYPYYDIAQERFCLNYAHNDDWLCPGSLARIGAQLLSFSRDDRRRCPCSNPAKSRCQPGKLAITAPGPAPKRLGAPAHYRQRRRLSAHSHRWPGPNLRVQR